MGTTRANDYEGMVTSVGWGQLVPVRFPVVALQTNKTVNDIAQSLALLTAVKIYRVCAWFDSASVAGTCSIQICAGTGNVAMVSGTPDTDYAGQPSYPPPYAPNGSPVFGLEQAITMTANTSTVLTPSLKGAASNYTGKAWDIVYGPGGQILTLRTDTNNSAAGNLYVAMLAKFYNPVYTKPILAGWTPGDAIP